MKTSLRVLIVEDSEFDARILVTVLRKGGYDPAFQRVETEETLKEALQTGQWDVVLADYNLPSFSAPAALRVEIQPTGRGDTIALDGSCGRPWPFDGS